MLELVATFIEIFFSLQFRRFDFGTTTLLEKKTRFSLWVHCTKIKIASFIHVLAHCDFGMHYKKISIFDKFLKWWISPKHTHTHTKSKASFKSWKVSFATTYHFPWPATCVLSKWEILFGFFQKELVFFFTNSFIKETR